MTSFCVDSSFLIGLYSDDDQHHAQAEAFFAEHFEEVGNRLLVPWPILFEVVSTRLARRPQRLRHLGAHWRTLRLRNQLELLDDRPFRDAALAACLDEAAQDPRRYRALSLVDRVVRDVFSQTRAAAILTFNRADFYDVCLKLGRRLLPETA